VGALTPFVVVARQALDDLVDLMGPFLRGDGFPQLQFSNADAARLVALALAGLLAAGLLVRALVSGGRGRVALPALLRWFERSRYTIVRHGAAALALLGVPFFLLALADPRTAFTRQDTVFPGRRIALLIDASSSMLTSLPSAQLAKGAPNDAAFFTTVGAARYFVQLRMKSAYRDLMSLIEFGDEAYVITPFTSDYENILLSISLIGDWNEFMNFPEQGTIIARAIDQGVGLFKAFDFLEASGNLMVIFSDGVDAEVLQDGRTAVDVLREASRARVPVFFIRTGRPGANAGGVPDAAWQSAVARTGGRFFAGTDESTILRAIHEIDRAATGRIELRQYTTQIPRFSPFAFAAVALWTLAASLRLCTPWFTTFP
jgi:hypothetical protein